MIFSIAVVLACNAPVSDTPTPSPTVTRTPLSTASSLATVEPSSTTSTDEPALKTPTFQASVTPSSSPQPDTVPTSAGIDRVNIFLIIVDDQGKSGDPIGCGDSIVAVERKITPTRTPLRAALEELLSIREALVGEAELYNALYQSALTVGDITIDQNGKAIVHLSGTLLSAGTCDDPRLIAQLTYTAMQFSTVKDVGIYVNGKLIQDVLSLE